MNQEALHILAEHLVSVSGGRLRLAFNEENATAAYQPEAAHFLKLDDHRLGRDFELYTFMATVQGEKATLGDVLTEVILPLKRTIPLSYTAGIEQMRVLGRHYLQPMMWWRKGKGFWPYETVSTMTDQPKTPPRLIEIVGANTRETVSLNAIVSVGMNPAVNVHGSYVRVLLGERLLPIEFFFATEVLALEAYDRINAARMALETWVRAR